jgi:multicomponent Na+:H+ antiporter subunit A
MARRRLAAVLFMGAVGFGVALLFVFQGAPDLALTALLIETLSLVIFALVLRSLPARFTQQPSRGSNALRGGIALGVGTMVGAFALFAGANRTADPISGEYLARALPEAEGRNVVNVILVDFRALDTLGEIVVLVVAALGIVTLVMASRADRTSGASPDPSAAEPALSSAARGDVPDPGTAERTLGSPRPERRGER